MTGRNNNFIAPRLLADHTADRRMILLATAATIIGTGAALGAWALLKLIALATNLFWFGQASTSAAEIVDAHVGLRVIVIPVAGALLIGLLARYGSDKIRGHGIPEAIDAILYDESRLSLKVALLKPLSAAISIGSGGPFGAEGPIIMTGGAIGSLFAQRFHLSAAERKTLLVAGAAAGMTGIFGTPVAAVLLAVEVLLFEWKPRSFVPVVLAAVVAFAWRPLFLGIAPLFPFASSPVQSWWLIGSLALGLGVVVGLEAALLSVLLYRIEDAFHRLPVHWMWWPAIGGIVVGFGGLIDARVLGAGYSNIQALLDGSMAIKVILILLVVKAVVWLVALGSGTSGGILAPLLIMGGALGAALGHYLPGSVGLWAMIGMAAMMSGAMRAPLTGALFAVELTGHFNALPATMAASTAAYAVSVLTMRRSILTEKIARRGRHVIQEFSVDAYDFLQADQIMTANPVTLLATMSINDVIMFFGSAAYRSYPVIDSGGRFVRMVSRTDAIRWNNATDLEHGMLSDAVSCEAQPLVHPKASIGEVTDLIIVTGIGRLPVVEPDTRRVVGMLTRHDLLKARSNNRRIEVERSGSWRGHTAAMS